MKNLEEEGEEEREKIFTRKRANELRKPSFATSYSPTA